jgi:hypothetical protein
MSETQERFDVMLRDNIWPHLRSLGFKRTRTTFHRAAGINWQVVNLQRSQFSNPGETSFTVNLGVAWEALRETKRGADWKPGRRPLEYQCQLRMRLGQLLVGRDHWWDLGPDTDVEQLGGAVVDAIERYGLPWLDEASDTEAYLDKLIANLADEPWQHLYASQCLAQALSRPDAEAKIAAERERRDHDLKRRRGY